MPNFAIGVLLLVASMNFLEKNISGISYAASVGYLTCAITHPLVVMSLLNC